MREPSKIYHVHDVGVEATWSAARANHDSAVFDGHQEDHDPSVIMIALLTRSPEAIIC